MIEVEQLTDPVIGAHVLLIEPLGTPNTGDAGGELTAAEHRI
jgi:hypothetical protein